VINKFDDERIRYAKQSHVGIGKLFETYNRGLKKDKRKFDCYLRG
jgi:hypothetical protein